MPARSPGDGDARSLIDAHARTVPASRRRAGGVHYTPTALAAEVLDMGLDVLGTLPRTVCDPSCGAGSFLLAAAQRLVEEGLDVHDVATGRLHGLELDDEAAGVAREVIARWAAEHGVDVRPDQVGVHVGDATAIDPRRWPGRPEGGFDLIVGNPPFLSQLSRRTARPASERQRLRSSFDDLGAYTDTAALFLRLGLELVRDGGVVALVQPQSFLAARDTAPVRASLLERSDLRALWGTDGRPFPDADVQVVVPVLRRRCRGAGRGGAADLRTDVRWGGTRPTRYAAAPPQGERGWGSLFATAVGLPELDDVDAPPLSSVATATAGFRDEYYALRDVTFEAAVVSADRAGGHGGPEPSARLVTVGMIDPLRLRWGHGTHRIGGRGLQRPPGRSGTAGADGAEGGALGRCTAPAQGARRDADEGGRGGRRPGRRPGPDDAGDQRGAPQHRARRVASRGRAAGAAGGGPCVA